MVPPNNLGPDLNGKAVIETQYRDIKQILSFNIKGYSDSDYVRCNMDQKSTSGACQLLEGKLVCWSAKKQQSIAMSSTKAEYVAAAGCCANILWMKSQLNVYDIIYEKVPIFYDNTSAIAISNNPVLHSRTKHIDIRFHFIRDHILKKDIELHIIPTQYQLVDIFTKPLDELTFKRLIVELVDYAKLIWEDIIHKLNKKTREKVVPYPRFISFLLEYMMPNYENEDLTVNPTQVISVLNWALKPNQPKRPLFIDHMLAMCKTDVPVFPKAPKTSSHSEKKVPQGKKCGAKSGLRRKQSSKHTYEYKTKASKFKTSQSDEETQSSSAKDKSPSHPSGSTHVEPEMHKEAQQVTGGPTSLGATSITTFRNALRAHYLPHSSMYVPLPSTTVVRPWWRLLMDQIIQYLGGKTGRKSDYDKDHFELKGPISTNMSSVTPLLGWDHEDANEHIEKVLEIFDLFHVPNITQDQIILRVFPMSPTGAAILWLRNKPSGSIKTREDLKTNMERCTELLIDVPSTYLSVTDAGAIDAKVSILEMAEYSQKWHNGTSWTRSTKTSDGLAAIQAQLQTFLRESQEGNEKKFKWANEQADVESRQTTIPFPSFDDYYSDEKKGSYGPQFLEANSYGASHIDNSIPQKEKDPGSFILPCYINNIFFDNSLADLGASVSVMPLSTYLNLGLDKLAHTKLTVELADRTMKYPKGIAKNVLVRFVVKNMDGYRDQDMGDIIFGEPFCKASCVEARRFDGFITIHNGNDNVTYQMARSHPRFNFSNAQCNLRIKSLPKDLAGKEIDKVGEVSIIWNPVCVVVMLVFSVLNWALKPNQPEGPLFTAHMLDICNTYVPVAPKAPKTSLHSEKKVPQGKKPGVKTDHLENRKILSSSVKIKSPQAIFQHRTHVVVEMHKEAQQAAGGPTSLEATNLMKDTRCAFFTPDSPQDEPIIVSDESEKVETEKDKDTHATSHDVPEDTLVPHPPSSKSAQIQELMAQVTELKTLKWKLLAEFLALPSQVSSVHAKLQTLDSLPSLLNKVANILTRPTTALLAEGEKNTNPATTDA
ncbi:retrovirus-related pol polyprotein from transposon TNT 1-94 [Tanacetum coccineum]